MNLLHIKYAVEVAQTGSINQAAEKLLIGAPGLSRAIRELETSLGVRIFERTSKGMLLTADGEIFIDYAKNILKQVDAVEQAFRNGSVARKQFSLSAPRASYISDAFARFSRSFAPGEEIEVFYKETNALRAVQNILQENYRLGIVRYAEKYDCYYKSMMAEKGLACSLIAQFRFVLVMNANSPLAAKDVITEADLKNYMEIAHADPYVPSLPAAEVKKEELSSNSDRRIFIFERGSQFELLNRNPETFMWVSPIPKALLDRHGLVQRTCAENRKTYCDVLIHRQEYTLSELDQTFIRLLYAARDEAFA